MSDKINNSRYFKKYLKYKIKYLELSGGFQQVYVDSNDGQPIYQEIYGNGIVKYYKFDGYSNSFYEVYLQNQPQPQLQPQPQTYPNTLYPQVQLHDRNIYYNGYLDNDGIWHINCKKNGDEMLCSYAPLEAQDPDKIKLVKSLLLKEQPPLSQDKLITGGVSCVYIRGDNVYKFYKEVEYHKYLKEYIQLQKKYDLFPKIISHGRIDSITDFDILKQANICQQNILERSIETRFDYPGSIISEIACGNHMDFYYISYQNAGKTFFDLDNEDKIRILDDDKAILKIFLDKFIKFKNDRCFHRDLHPSNITFDGQNIYLIDYNLKEKNTNNKDYKDIDNEVLVIIFIINEIFQLDMSYYINLKLLHGIEEYNNNNDKYVE